MANIPQKSPDPTEDALSAIREALEHRPTAQRPPRPPAAPVTPPTTTISRKPPPPAADLFNEEPQPTTWESDERAAAPRRQ